MLRFSGPCLVAFGLLLASDSAFADLWQCEAKAAFEATDAGELRRVGDKDVYFGVSAGDVLYFDESSGIVRLVRKEPAREGWEFKFEPWQRGSSENSAVGIFMYKGSRANPVKVIRVTAFKQPHTLLFLDEHGEVVTGLCKSLAR